MSWKRYAAERTAASACWLAVVVVVVFVIYRVVAPFPERLVGSLPADDERRVRALEHAASGLDDFVRQLAGGSLGESFASGDVNEIVANAAPVTISVVVGAVALALLIGVPLGLSWSGSPLRPVSLLTHLPHAVLLPWIGLGLSYWIGYRASLTPIAGYCDLWSPPAAAQCGGLGDWADQLILPWTTLASPLAVLYARGVRALADDVRRAAAARPEERAMAVTRRRRAAVVAMTRHVTRDLGVLVGLAIFVETVFGLPGLGRTLLESMIQLDYPVGEGVLVAAALLALALHLAVDLVLAAVLPEARPA